MTELYFLVGLPASGKSTWADKSCETLDAVVVSSDSIREEIYGSESILGDPNEVFRIVHERILHFLEEGVNVILDSTGLSYKHRIPLLEKVSKIGDVEKIAVVFATDFGICSSRNVNRERRVPHHAMRNMYKSFTMPQYNEGWDDIRIVWDFKPSHYILTNLFDELDGFDQENYHHSLTIGEHCKKAASLLDTADAKVYTATLLHDIGKQYTQTFKNMKGETSEIAHYYGHESVSAYEAMFYLHGELEWTDDDVIYACGLIQYHMRPYFAKTEKSIKKLTRLVGEKMYNDILLVHEADKAAH